MSTTATCVTPIKGSMYRLVKLDTCGSPVTGASSIQIISKGFVQVQMTPVYEDGVEFFERTADGSICVNQIDDPVLKRFELSMDFCEVNQTGASYMASMRELTVGAGATGTGFAAVEGVSSNRWSLEVWQQVAGSGACNAAGVQQYIYNAWPNVGAAKLSAYTIANARSTLTIGGMTRGASTVSTIGWGDGPGSGTSWMPSGFTAVAGDHWYWNVTSTPPPAAGCSPVTLT